jgi:hypothetical protein
MLRKSRNARLPLIETMESRRLNAVDLVAGPVVLEGPTDPISWYGMDDLIVTVTNASNTPMGSGEWFVVGVYFQDSLGGPKQLVASDSMSALGGWESRSLRIGFLGTYWVDDNEGFLTVVVDSTNRIAESNEANNADRGLGIDTLRYSLDADTAVGSPGVRGRPMQLGGLFNEYRIGDEYPRARDIDVFEAVLPGGRNFWFELRENSYLDAAMRLYDQNWNLVAISHFDTAQSGYGAYIEVSTTVTQTYRLVISNEENASADPRTLAGREFYGSEGTYLLGMAEKILPTVTLNAVDRFATEDDWRIINPPEPAGWLLEIVRNGGNQPWRPVDVQLQFLGSVTPADLGIASFHESFTIEGGASSTVFYAGASEDGINELTESLQISLRHGNDYIRGTPDSATFFLYDNPATHQPFVLGSGFYGLDISGQRVFVQFSEDVGASITHEDYELKNLDTGVVYPTSTLQALWSPTIQSAIVYFTGFAGGNLPDGNWQLTLKKNGVYNAAGRPLDADRAVRFQSLRGDTNGDNAVNFNDLLILAQNYGQNLNWNGGPWKGDFDRNNVTNFSDLLILAQQYGKTITPPMNAMSMQGTPGVRPASRVALEVFSDDEQTRRTGVRADGR